MSLVYNMAGNFDTGRKGFTFIWNLENFEYCGEETGQFLRSPTFIIETIDRSKWSLWIYPRGYKSESYTSVFLSREEDSKGPTIIEVDYELAFIAPDGSALTSKRVQKHGFPKLHTFGFFEFQRLQSVFSKRSEYLSQNTLTVRCRIWKAAGEVKCDGQCIARTRIGIEMKSFLWKIPYFSSVAVGQEITFRLKSTSDDKPLMSFVLSLRKNHKSRTIICIEFITSDESIVFSSFKLYLVDAKGNYVDCGEHEFPNSIIDKWPDKCHPTELLPLSLSKDELMDNKDLFLPNNTLTLFGEYIFSSGVVFNGIETTTYGRSNTFIPSNTVPEYLKTANVRKLNSVTSDLRTDLYAMLQENILCDVQLCTESEIFPAHSFILSARSPIFRVMFKSDMKKKVKDRIDIVDIKSDTVRCMLHYMYTDSLPELRCEIAFDLYVAAKKYQILSLRDKCSSFLNANLNLTNVCTILFLADLHQDKELKSAAQDFILRNDKSIINSSEWKLLMKRNLQLAADTMILRFKE